MIFPAAGYTTMAVQAARQHTQMVNPTPRVDNILFRNISIGKAIGCRDRPIAAARGPDGARIVKLLE